MAIDGPSGSGKSTVARAASPQQLGLEVLDTGAMYRAVTLAALDRGARSRPTPTPASPRGRRHSSVDARGAECDARRPRREPPRSAGPRSPPRCRRCRPTRRCGRCSSPASGRGSQEHGGGVVEGRDIGTVVFPDAPRQGVPDRDRRGAGAAPPARRGRRRPRGRGRRRATRRSTRRDALDSSRAASPLRAADDAVVIDTTERDADERRRRDRRPGSAMRRERRHERTVGRPRDADLLPRVPGPRAHAVQVPVPGHRAGQGARAARRARTSSRRRTARCMDILFDAVITRRRVRFMAKQELFSKSVPRLAVRRAGRLPGRPRRHRPQGRSGDSSALLQARRAAGGLSRGDAPQRPRDRTAVRRRRLPRGEAQRADRAGRRGRHRGDPGQRARRSRSSDRWRSSSASPSTRRSRPRRRASRRAAGTRAAPRRRRHDGQAAGRAAGVLRRGAVDRGGRARAAGCRRAGSAGELGQG